ncbi:ATP-binding cassette, subfamily B [Lachnospiraceae bacterium NE2001]|nr:ATP-binding cassette, subfamily B [Lachnospiraceae bacterium NE2001]
MRDIIKITKKYFKNPLFYILALIFTTFQGISEIILPRYMGDIVNKGIMTKNLDVVYSIGAKMLIFTVILGLSGYLSFIFINIAVLRFGNETRTKLYDKVTRLDYKTVKEIGGGSVITRLTGDVEKVISVIKVTIDLVYKPLLLSIGGFIMIFSINLNFAFVFLSFIIIQVIIIYIFIHKSAPMFMKVQIKIDAINQKLQAVLRSMRLIKSSTTESYEESSFEGKNKELYSSNISVLSLMSALNPIVMFIMNITIVVIVVMIGYQSKDNSTTIGNVMMSITYAEQILMSIMINSNLARTISEISPSLKRLLEIDEAELPANGTEVLEKVESITLDNVTKSYVENRPVVENLNLTLNSGDRIAIVGGTSGGKSTLAMLAAGLTDATAGTVKINGIDAADYDKQTLRERIALVGAYNNSIYSGTYVDNISLGRDIDREAVEKAAKAAEIDEFISSLDYGYDSLAYSSGNTISGGQRQRLMIARALAASPDVLILDDSTSSLDYSTEKKVLDNITSMYAGITLILITERAGSAASCDKSYTLEKGGLV